MKVARFIAICSYGTVILGGFILGLIYTFITEAVSYHVAAFGVSWQDLSSNAQWMILNFERSAAAGFITTSLAMLFLLIHAIRDNSLWSYIGVFVVAMNEWLSLLTRVISVIEHTPASPPLTLNTVAVVLILIGLVASLITYNRKLNAGVRYEK